MGLSNLGKKLARIGRDTKNGVQKMSDSVSIKGRISSEKRSLERLFAVIGESVYKEDPDTPKAGLEDEYAAVKVAYANIEKYSKQLDQVNGIVYCPNCGKPADPGDKFCAKCGARLTPEESTGAKIAQDFRDAGQEVGKIAGNAAGKTGEFFGSAAAKTKNGFTSLKDRSVKFMKDASSKMSFRKKAGEAGEDPEQDADQVLTPEEEKDDFADALNEAAETPAEETAAEENPAEETAAEETPAEETAAEENPAEETAAEETPAEETQAEETPAAEVSEKKEGDTE